MTKKELEAKSDIQLLIDIVAERKRHVVSYSPIGLRLMSILQKLWDGKIKEVKNAQLV